VSLFAGFGKFFLRWGGREDLLEQLTEKFEPGRGEMAQLAAVEFAHGWVETLEEVEGAGGDAGGDDAAVIFGAFAGDETEFIEAVEEAGHVRVAGDHAQGNVAATEAGGAGAAEDAQDVVLGGRKAVGFEEEFDALEEFIGGVLEGDEEVFLGEGGGAWEAGVHGGRIHVTTTIVKREERGGGLGFLGRGSGPCSGEEKLALSYCCLESCG